MHTFLHLKKAQAPQRGIKTSLTDSPTTRNIITLSPGERAGVRESINVTTPSQ